MIKKHGTPQYCKIDVEGFEDNVLYGLTQPIEYISFEFASESLHITKKCLGHLVSLGYKKFNCAMGEKSEFFLSNWISHSELLDMLHYYGNLFPDMWGDIYCCYHN